MTSPAKYCESERNVEKLFEIGKNSPMIMKDVRTIKLYSRIIAIQKYSTLWIIIQKNTG